MSTYYDINESLFDQIMDAMLDQIPSDMDKREGGVAYTLLAPAALELVKLYQDLDAIEGTSFLIDENGQPSAYGSYIDRRVNEFGVFRKAGSVSSATVTLSADPAVTVPAFTQIMASDGSAQVFEVPADVTATPSGVQTVVTSLEASSAANVPAGAIDTVLGDLAATVSVVSSTAADGGVDEESDEVLIRRFLELQRVQSNSGNAAHYERWATDVPGISRARVIPVWAGNGTVKVVLVGDEARTVPTSKVEEVYEYIETQRPIGAVVTVVSADAQPIDVTATISVAPTTTLEAVSSIFTEELDTYLEGAKVGDTITVARVGSILMGIDGVLDYSGLSINGETTAIPIIDTAVPVVGEVTFDE